MKIADSSIIAGALFDFMGFLTSRKEEVTLSGHHDAGVAVNVIKEFAAKRGLSLDDADVTGWQNAIGGKR